MVICKKVSFKYDSKKVLKDVSLQLNQGEIGVIIGLNGCGKSTLLKCIGKEIDNYYGNISTDVNCRYIKELPIFAYKLTGIDYLEMLLTLGGSKANNLVNKLVDSIGIRPDLQNSISIVSPYTRQVLVLLTAICLDSDTILLDDPFKGLDHHSQKLVIQLIKMLKEENKCILIATNLIYYGFEVADVLFLMQRGKIKQIKNDFSNGIEYEKQMMNILLK